MIKGKNKSPASKEQSKDIEIVELKFQLNELQSTNSTLTQYNIKLKQQVSELNDMIYGLDENDKS